MPSITVRTPQGGRSGRTVCCRGGALVVAGSVLWLLTACTATGTLTKSSTPTASASTSPRTVASDQELRETALDRLPRSARNADALVWTTAAPRASGPAIDMTGKRLLIAAACDGGGTITVSISSVPDRVLRCDGLRSAGPIDVSATLSTDPPGGAEFDVGVSSGHPHWFAQAAAVTDAGGSR